MDVDKAIASFYRFRLYQELSDEKSKIWHYIIKDFQVQKKIFEIYGIFGYITKYFESLHTMGDSYIVQDIEDYISGLVM